MGYFDHVLRGEYHPGQATVKVDTTPSQVQYHIPAPSGQEGWHVVSVRVTWHWDTRWDDGTYAHPGAYPVRFEKWDAWGTPPTPAEERAEAKFVQQRGENPPEKPHLTPTPGSAPLCTPPPQFYWEAAPPSLQDVAHGIREAADAVDPLMPDPATVGGPDVGDIIGQAYLWRQAVPPNNPYFEMLVR